MNNTTISILLGLAILGSVGTYMLSSRSTTDVESLSIKDLEFYKFSNIPELEHRLALFKEWTAKFNKPFGKLEAPYKFKVWNDNYEVVQAHNAKNLSWTLEMTQFADLTHEEFAAVHLGFKPELSTEGDENLEILSEVGVPTSYDWRDHGVVSSVKNQGSCGSCYAFASVAALESLYKLKKGALYNLSNQQLTDCTTGYGNQGCNGGLMTNCYKYTQANGIDRAKYYLWAGKQQTCKQTAAKVLFKNSGYKTVSVSADQLKAAVATMPVTVGVEADQSAFQLYKGGIVSSGCGTSLDHAITIVGYATSGSTDYWIVKNQWGTSWGEKGYIRIARGTQNGGKGVCGINAMASYPTY